MTIPSIEGKNLPRNEGSIRRQIGQTLRRYFEMPPTNPPTLPQALLARTRLRSWPLASLAVGGGFYLLFLALASIDGTLAYLIEGGKIGRDDSVVLLITGHGLKTKEAVDGRCGEARTIKPSLQEFENLLEKAKQ